MKSREIFDINDTKRIFVENYGAFYSGTKFPKLRFLFFDPDVREELSLIAKRFYLGNKDIVEEIKSNVCDINTPYVQIPDAETFFTILTSYLNKYYEIIENSNKHNAYYETVDMAQYIWLRATKEDLLYPNKFLFKELDMLNNSNIEKFSKKTFIERVPFLDYNLISASITPAQSYDESPFEFNFALAINPTMDRYDLPKVRFGIFIKNGHKVCHIGSVQNKSIDNKSPIEKAKYKINKGVPPEYLFVEPKMVISLMLFMNIMLKEGITEFEMQGNTVLDKTYHEILSRNIKNGFLEMYPDGEKPENDIFFDAYKNQVEHYCKREDQIIYNKTVGLYSLGDRIMQTYEGGEVLFKPGEKDSCYHFRVTGNNNLIGASKELKDVIDEKYEDLNCTFEDVFEENNEVNYKTLMDLIRHGNEAAIFFMGFLFEYGIVMAKDKPTARSYYSMGHSNLCKLALLDSLDMFESENKDLLKCLCLELEDLELSSKEREIYSLALYTFMCKKNPDNIGKMPKVVGPITENYFEKLVSSQTEDYNNNIKAENTALL